MSASKNSNRLAMIAASLLLNLPLSTFGQSTTDDGPQPDLEALFEAREFEGKDGHSLLYRLFTPRPYDPSRQYPVLVFLHGNGGRGDDNLGQLQRGNAGVLSAFLSADARARYACFIVAPQVPREPEASSDWGGLERPPRGDPARKATPLLRPASTDEPIDRMVRILGALGAEFSIDPKRIYLVGVSMGGHGTWSALMHYPDRFAAAAPMMGAGDPSAAHRIRAAVWAFHGSQDTTVPPERSREMVHAMKQAGATPRYTEYSDLGHSGPGQRAVSEPEFFPWLFSQRLD